MKNLSEKYKAAKLRVPKTNTIREKLKFESYTTFATALGINACDYINYCIKGECWVKNCTQDHSANPKPKVAIITTAYTDMLKDLQSKT